MRTFDSGATRNDDADKIDYEGFLSPLVLKAYAKYLHKHRLQADGKLRDSDNWQKLFDEKHFDVCMKSMWRHFMDVWGQHRGMDGEQDIVDSLCALLFNTMAYLYKIEKDKQGLMTLPPKQDWPKCFIKSNITKIYLDMDGVLADFISGVNKKLGIVYNYDKQKVQMKWNWYTQCGIGGRPHGFTDDEVNAICTEDFWSNLEWTDDGMDIFCSLPNNIDIYFLSVPMKDELEAIVGKTRWLRNKFAHAVNNFTHWDTPIISRDSKAGHAGPTALLIDDKDENVNAFRAAGGQAILVARPWNSRWEDEWKSFELFKKDLLDINF